MNPGALPPEESIREPDRPDAAASGSRRVLVTGATGYVGGRLVAPLLDAGHEIRCLARTPAKLDDAPWRERVEVVAGDVGSFDSLLAAMDGVAAAYYLVHAIGTEPDWEERERRDAATFRDAAAAAGVEQIVYLGGLGDDRTTSSEHLRSRHEVGRVLASGPVAVTELRAAVVIGSGSASFEMLRHLVEVLPIMITPRWVETRCQPIALRDVLAHLVGVLGRREAYRAVYEIGGPDVLSYREMMQVYAEEAGLRRRLILGVPVLSPRLSSLWIGLVTPLPPRLARPLVDGLATEVVVRDDRIRELLPIRPTPYREAVRAAIERVADLRVLTSWTDATSVDPAAGPQPLDAEWAGGVVLGDTRVVSSAASPDALFRTVCGVGGDRGWYVANWLWDLRGLVDQLLGGVGRRRGRRHPDELGVGDALDFWRVEELEPGRHLRLRAEMRLPGDAWLEWMVSRAPDGRARLEQRARFHPRGLAGRAYWYGLLPVHRLIFRKLAERLAAAAAARDGTAGAAA